MVEKFEKELPVDKKIEVMPQMAESAPELPSAPAPAPIQKTISEEALQAPAGKDEELLMIENILSEDLDSAYRELSAAKQAAFKKRGEQVALKIKLIMEKTKVKIHDIFELVKNWLLMLPKINYYFLEQEAKIKTDKILELKRTGQELEK